MCIRDRSHTQPYGLFGGKGGHCDSGTVLYPDGSVNTIKSGQVPKGSVVRIQTAGGGGWGDPAKRDPAKLEWDVLNLSLIHISFSIPIKIRPTRPL